MPNPAGTGLPIEESFDISETGEGHPTEDAAIKAEQEKQLADAKDAGLIGCPVCEPWEPA